MSEKKKKSLTVSRRQFIKGLGTTAVASATASARSFAQEIESFDQEQLVGPGPVPMTFTINGETVSRQVEPRTTLLELLRDDVGKTGAKEVCDRAGCGACTVLRDGEPINACMTLAIEAQGADLKTVEGLSQDGELSPLQAAFVEEDGLMCGYCTSGFLMSLTALLDRNPTPTEAEVRQAVEGNVCRCGTYPRIYRAALRAAGQPTSSRVEVIPFTIDGQTPA